jgi:hypothetical protein
MAPCGYGPSFGQQRPVDEVQELRAGDGGRHRTGQPQLHGESSKVLTVAAPAGRVHQLVAQRDQDALDARDLVQYRADIESPANSGLLTLFDTGGVFIATVKSGHQDR